MESETKIEIKKKSGAELFRECEAMLFSVSDIFGIDHNMSISEPVYFRIPKYQRSYVWEQGTYDFSNNDVKELKKNKQFKGQLEYFWEDLISTINGTKHYTGLIGLQKMSNEDKVTEKLPSESLGFYVIDGQQRFTTIMLLISVMNKNGALNRIILDKDSLLLFDYTKDKGEFKKILRDILLNNPCDKSHNYKEKLINAKKFLQQKLEENHSNNSSDNIKNALLNNILFNVFFSVKPNEKELNNRNNIAPEIIFESINNRGKELSKIDILKNRVFYLDKQKKFNKTIVDDIEEYWAEIFNNLSSIELLQVKDDDYLLTHYYIFSNDSNIKTKTSVLLQNVLDIFLVTEDCGKMSNYFKTLRDCSKYWLWINNANEIKIDKLKDSKDKDKEELEIIIGKLSHLVDSNYVKSMIILLIYSYNDLKFIELDKLIDTLEFFEKYLYIYQFFNYKNPDLPHIATKTKNLLFDDKGKFRNKEDFNKQLEITIEELKGDIKDVLNKDNLKIWAAKIMNKDTCFYSWNGVFYTLYELNNSLGDGGKIKWRTIVDDKSKTIEHIYPENANGKNNDDLSKAYWECACPSELLTDKSKMIHSLGNLMPVSQSINSSVSNKLYPKKLKEYCKSSAMAMSLKETFKTDIYWDLETIKNRTEVLFKDIQNKWFVNEEEGYEFQYVIDNDVLNLLISYNESQGYEKDLEDRRKEMKEKWNGFESKNLCDKISDIIKKKYKENHSYEGLFDKDFCNKKFGLNNAVLSNKCSDEYFNLSRNKLFLLKLDDVDSDTKKEILKYLENN